MELGEAIEKIESVSKIEGKPLTNDEIWLALLLLCFSTPGIFDKQETWIEEEKRKQEVREMCGMVEWEQDMGAHIPFCRFTNDICDYHCLGKG